ncbi:IdeS/Mac family cysteine endopeptidase [Campylobacter porcelli]|uniref:Autotransporter outer membrane beta-barrel domain-containing protein n=2 Tax=Campylobacter TaxID=194 RepID=A0ABU7M3B7_9BACT|nr:autotransporter outer membrane beta-barrel domain-containing protein [Campylobacter sp. CX2-4855-23]
MRLKLSKFAILACVSTLSTPLLADEFWASGVNINSGWSAYLQHPNQCWGAVAGNTLGWWQKNLTTNVDLKDGAPQGNKAITDWFYEKYPHIQGGLQPYRGMIYYLQEFSPNFKIYETHNQPTYLEREYGPTKISGAPFWTERYNYQSEGITKSLIENFKTGKVVAALTDDTHTVTLWGIEVDENGKIKKGYVSDSVTDRAGQLTLREVIGNYAPDNKGNETFRFLYSYYVSSTNTYVTDLYEIYSITYLSIDEARNNGTYKDTSNRKDCLLSVLPGSEWACGVSTSEGNQGNTGNQGSSGEGSNTGSTTPEGGNSGNQGSTGNEGNTGNESGNQSGSNQGSSGNQGNTGGSNSGSESGNQGNTGNQGSNGEGSNTGSTTPEGGNSGNQGSTGNEGNTGNESGNQSGSNQGSSGNQGNTGGSNSGSESGNQGNTGNQGSNGEGSNTGSTTPEGGNSGNQGGNTGGTLAPDVGNQSGSTSGSTSGSSTSNPSIEATTKSVQNAVSRYGELNLKIEEIGDTVFYKIQKNGKDIALYNPDLNLPLVQNKGLVNYDIKKDENGGIEIIKTTNQEALKEANDASKLSIDMNYVDINNLNKRMGELRGINATTGSWARVLSGEGSADGFENRFTHIQAGFDKQSQISSGSIFSGMTITHTKNDIDGNNAKGDVKAIGGGFYISGVFDSGWYIDAIAKYTRNNHKMDYNFPNMSLSFLNTDYNTNSLYLGGEFGYRFDFDNFYVEPQAEFVYLNNSGATIKNQNGFEMDIKGSDLLVGRAGFNFAREIWLGHIRAYALGGLSYQWEMVKNSEIVIDGESAKYNDKDSRMLMNLGLNMIASDNLRIGLTLEKSAFGDYDTDLAVNLNARYSF